MISAKAATALVASNLKEPPVSSELADGFMKDLFNGVESTIIRFCNFGESSLSFNFPKDRQKWLDRDGLSTEQILNTLSDALVKAGYTVSVSDELVKADITITESGSVSHRNEDWYSVEIFWPEE